MTLLKNKLVIVAIVVQCICALFFVANIASALLGFAPISWQASEIIEIGAAFGLLLGIVLGAYAFQQARARAEIAEMRLRVASTEFVQMMHVRFQDWGLTPAEKDVALFAIKGMTTAEIAELRSTSEGTVKAQTNAIYRKAGVSGRAQLLSLFIDELLAEAKAYAPDQSME